MMIGVAIGLSIAAGIACAVIVAEWLIRSDERAVSPFEAVASRFPSELYFVPPANPDARAGTDAAPRLSAGEFVAALEFLDRVGGRRWPPQPRNAVFNDGQIASMRARLNLNAEQLRYWPEMEGALRQIVWEQRGGANQPTVDPKSLERLKETAAWFMAVLNERQKSEIRLMARVGGLKVDF